MSESCHIICHIISHIICLTKEHLVIDRFDLQWSHLQTWQVCRCDLCKSNHVHHCKRWKSRRKKLIDVALALLALNNKRVLNCELCTVESHESDSSSVGKKHAWRMAPRSVPQLQKARLWEIGTIWHQSYQKTHFHYFPNEIKRSFT